MPIHCTVISQVLLTHGWYSAGYRAEIPPVPRTLHTAFWDCWTCSFPLRMGKEESGHSTECRLNVLNRQAIEIYSSGPRILSRVLDGTPCSLTSLQPVLKNSCSQTNPSAPIDSFMTRAMTLTRPSPSPTVACVYHSYCLVSVAKTVEWLCAGRTTSYSSARHSRCRRLLELSDSRCVMALTMDSMAEYTAVGRWGFSEHSQKNDRCMARIAAGSPNGNWISTTLMTIRHQTNLSHMKSHLHLQYC